MLQPCLDREMDRREALCRQHDKDYIVWEGSDRNHGRPCDLHCHHVGGVPGQLHRVNDSLLDGEVCGQGRLGVCQGGQCEV